MQLYRITSFDRFREEFEARQLGFVTYDIWKYPAEGPILRSFDLEGGRQRILDWLKTHASGFDQSPEFLLAHLINFRKTIHMQSWSRTDESSLMWDSYCHAGREIRIETTGEKVKQLGGVSIVRIDYMPISLRHELAQVFKKGKIHHGEVFRRKKPYWKDEREMRLMTDIDMAWLEKTKLPFSAPPSAIRQCFQDFVDRGIRTPEDVEKNVASWIKMACLKLIPFGHVDNFIESVLVGPRANEEFVAEVEAFCINHGLNYVGKSKMLKFELPDN